MTLHWLSFVEVGHNQTTTSLARLLHPAGVRASWQLYNDGNTPERTWACTSQILSTRRAVFKPNCNIIQRSKLHRPERLRNWRRMSSSETVTPVADREAIEIATKEPEITKLCMFEAPESIDVKLARTAEYVKDPRAYLTKTIGEATMKARGEMLCIPDSPIEGDMYGMSATKTSFETHIAKLIGKENGLFFSTGIQAQLAALKIYCESAKKSLAAWHISCHLELAEQNAYRELYQLDRVLLGSVPNELPTVEEIRKVIDLPEAERPAVIVVELPNRVLACETYTFEQLQEISAACKAASVAFHMDGARLWEIEPWYQATAGKTFVDLGALFDSVYVSMYKGLGGATGAFLLSNDSAFIDEAKLWQRRAGGNAFSSSYYWIDCQRGFNERIGTFASKREKIIAIAEKTKKATAAYKAEDGASVVQFRPTTPNCCTTHVIFHGFTNDELIAARDKVQEDTNVQVFTFLRPKLSAERLLARYKVMTNPKFKMSDQTGGTAIATDLTHWTEFTIIPLTEKLDNSAFVDAYVELCKALLEAKK
jgi:threonine aldolase